jgi:hypothetical protein
MRHGVWSSAGAARVLAVLFLLSAVHLAHAQIPTDVLKACKNEVGARYLNIPMAYISVDRGSTTANANYMVNWTATAPGGKQSKGFCVIDPSYNVLRFETTGGPAPGSGSRLSPEDAMRICKSEASNRLRVGMTYITVQVGSQGLEGSYMISWRSQPPLGVRQSGSCDLAPNGKVRNFQFDRSSPGRPGAPGGGKQPSGAVQYTGLVRNRNSQKCMDVARASIAVGGNIQQQTCQGRPNQQWEFVVVGSGEFAIRNVNSGLVLDVTGASKSSDANIQQYTWLGNGNQRWRLNQAAAGTQIMSVGSGKCLDVAYQSRADGGNVIQWDCHGGASQRWDIGGR